MTSCSSDEPTPDADKLTQQVASSLGSLNISDAKMIYQKEANDGTRATAETGFYKIDVNGNQVKLVIKNETGEETDIEISDIRNINDRYLAFHPNVWQFAVDNGLDGGDLGDYLCFVDRSNNKISAIDIDKIISDKFNFNDDEMELRNIIHDFIYNDAAVFNSPDGTFYIMCGRMAKIDIPNLKVSLVLPAGQSVDDGYFYNYFKFGGVNLNGDVLYKPGKIFLTTGGIKVTTGQSFVLNNQIYNITDNTISILEPGGDADLTSREIAKIPASGDFNNIELLTCNKVRNSILILYHNSYNNGIAYEFDGNSLKESGLDYNVVIQYYYALNGLGNVFKTSEAWYLRDGNSFTKIDFATFNVSTFTLNGIEIYDLTANEDAPEFCFTGLNYSDASKVFGTVKSDNSVVITGNVPSSTKIVNMIPLN